MTALMDAVGEEAITVPTGNFALTEKAIAARVPIIRQAALSDGEFGGYADALVLDRVNPVLSATARRAAHPGSYSVLEVKLSGRAQADAALQTAAYASMLSRVLKRHGVPGCRHAFVSLGDTTRRLDVNALSYVFRRCRQQFAAFLRDFHQSHPLPPIDAPIDALRPWSQYAQYILDDTDSLLNIANIRRSQATFITTQLGVSKLTSFAELSTGSIDEVARLKSPDSRASVFRRLQLQARLQLETQNSGTGAIAYRVLQPGDVLASYALNRIAPRSAFDVYFDIEGYPLFEDDNGGLEYLFGIVTEGDAQFYSWWAHSRVEEEDAFTRLIEWLWTRNAELAVSREMMHVYHYGNYEIAALRRIAARALTVAGKEAGRRLERLIGSGCFIDVYKVVKNGLMVGERSYSIKKIEKLVGISRSHDDLTDAQSSVAMYHEWSVGNRVETGENALAAEVYGDDHLGQILRDISLYNKQDCESLQQVVAWLRQRARECGIEYRPIPRWDGECSGNEDGVDLDANDLCLSEACGRSALAKLEDAEVIRRCDELSAMLLSSTSAPGGTVGSKRVSAEKPAELDIMAHLLHFHARERGPGRFEFMQRITKAYCLDVASLMSDHECLFVSKFVGTTSNETGAHFYEFSFDTGQPLSIKKGGSVAVVVGDPLAAKTGVEEGENRDMITGFMSVSEVCTNSGKIVVRSKTELPIDYGDPISLVRSDELVICAAPMRKSILHAAENMAAGNMSANPLVRNFLARSEAFEASSNKTVTADNLLDALLKVKGRAVVIQGPPGSGKTTFSAKLIKELLKKGKTVAVSSNSHAAIDNLLSRVVSHGVDVGAICKIGTRPAALRAVRGASNIAKLEIGPLEGEARVEAKTAGGKRGGRRVSLVGGTVYAFARGYEETKFDYLFVDEASQVSMADFVAMALCAESAVLVGDQQQLGMPIQGAHPASVEKSSLGHLVGGETSIVEASRGIFLDTSFRMQTDICRFISTHFYDSALRSHSRCRENRIDIDVDRGELRKGCGIAFVRSDLEARSLDEAHSRHSLAEARIVSRLIHQLLGCSATINGSEQYIGAQDILVVCSYNAQVVTVAATVAPAIRVGTVDRFQGQEAAVVIVSTCAKWVGDGGDGDRQNLEFSTSANRLNVAISRASCLAVVIGHSMATRSAEARSLDVARNFALYQLLTEYRHDEVQCGR